MTDRQLSELDVSELDLVVRRCDEILQLLAGLRAQLGDHQASEARRRARRRAVVEKKPAPVVVEKKPAPVAVRISGVGAAVRFLRESGAMVWQFDDGRYAVNGREVQPMHILKMANAKRVLAGMPLFELEYSA
jgi:hypothetical protein